MSEESEKSTIENLLVDFSQTLLELAITTYDYQPESGPVIVKQMFVLVLPHFSIYLFIY